MKIKKRFFGTLSNGQDVDLYILKNGSMSVCIINYGAILASVLLPSKKNYWDDICLGFSTLHGYTVKNPYFGGTIGRYANRIAKSSFRLDGKTYHLAANDGTNSLHGGLRGFDKVVWEAEPFEDRKSVNLRLRYVSPEGEEGFPGELDTELTYSLSSENALSILFEAKSNAPTPINLTNHAYFNLKGEGRGDILAHELQLFCSKYLPVDERLIPTGEFADVAASPMDFRSKKPIGKDIAATAFGYDHCFVVDPSSRPLSPCAEVSEPDSGRIMRVSTTQPGVQLYTGNYLSGIPGKRGALYEKHSGFCLETQNFPDAPNQSKFPDCILRPRGIYNHSTVFEFIW